MRSKKMKMMKEKQETTANHVVEAKHEKLKKKNTRFAYKQKGVPDKHSTDVDPLSKIGTL